MASASASASPSPAPDGTGSSAPPAPVNRHKPTAVEVQRMQLARLLKDPSKPAHVPAPPKEKTIRPAREMMKNVQGSSAGAGSGEFHVYKAARRREYERLKIMEETTEKETIKREFEDKKRQWEEEAESKTAKNRAKRQKKKERAKGKAGGGTGASGASGAAAAASTDANKNTGPLKKRRLVNGAEVVFRKPGEEGSEDEEDEEADVGPTVGNDAAQELEAADDASNSVPIAVDTAKITIIEED